MERKRKTLVGRVVSDGMDKTVVVAVESRRRHPLYRKVIRLKAKLQAHDEGNACRVGDVVKIVESRPLSKSKHWRVQEIVSKEEVEETPSDDSAL